MVPKITTLVSDSVNLIIFDPIKFSHILNLNDSIIITVCNVLANCISMIVKVTGAESKLHSLIIAEQTPHGINLI